MWQIMEESIVNWLFFGFFLVSMATELKQNNYQMFLWDKAWWTPQFDTWKLCLPWLQTKIWHVEKENIEKVAIFGLLFGFHGNGTQTK